MGLLDDFSSFIKTPEGMGLLSAVAGGLAGANRGTPINNLGRAGLAGVMGYGNALDRQERTAENALQNQYRKIQIDDLTRNRKAMEQYRATLPENMRMLPDNLLVEAYKQSMKPKELFDRVNPKDFTPESLAKYQKSGDVGDLVAVVPFDRPTSDIQNYRLSQTDPAFAKYLQSQKTPTMPSYDYVATPYGIIRLDRRGGPPTMVQLPGGGPVFKSADSPDLQGRIAGAKAAAKTLAEETTKATLDAPRVIDNAETAIKYSEELLKHPGFSIAVGKSAMLGTQKIPGTVGYDFINRLDQLKGGAFLEAFNTLKGGGQITEVEGKKATDAIARMDNATSEGEFKAAVKDYQDVIRKGMNRAKMKAKPVAPVQQPQQGGAKFLGFE